MEDGKRLLEQLDITFPTGTTFDAGVVRAYSLLGMSTTKFMTPDGKVFKTWTGLLSREKMTELVQQLLQASKR